MPIISAFPTGESTVDYTGPKSGLPSLEEGKVTYVTDEKRLYTGNADGANTQVPNADDIKTEISNAVTSHNSAEDAHTDKFAKYLPLAGGTMTGGIKGIKTPTEDTMPTPKSYVDEKVAASASKDLSNIQFGLDFKGISKSNLRFTSGICYGNGTFVAIAEGSIVYSLDGISWTSELSSDQKYTIVCYGNGKFVALSPSGAAYSVDGITWIETTLPIQARWSRICCGNDKFVVSPEYGNNGLCSADGINWVKTTLPDDAMWDRICYGNGVFIVVGWGEEESTVIRSTDGINWTKVNLPEGTEIENICYGNGKFVGLEGRNSDNAVSSDDGINWIKATMPAMASLGSMCYWRSICYGNGVFVATAYEGEAKAAYSTDGTIWTETELPVSGSFNLVQYVGGRFVALKYESDTVIYSANGIDWAKTTMPFTARDYYLVFGDGKFIVVDVFNSPMITYAEITPPIVNQLVSAGVAPITKAHRVTLLVSGWNSSTKQQTVAIADVVADETAQLILPMPAAASMAAYNDAGIQCTAQAAGKLTFTADTVPTAAIDVYVTVTPVAFS